MFYSKDTILDDQVDIGNLSTSGKFVEERPRLSVRVMCQWMSAFQQYLAISKIFLH